MSETASADPADSEVLSSYDWTSLTLPASSCDPEATGDITLVDGTGEVTVDEVTAYTVTAELPPDYGDLAGRPAAIIRYSCLLHDANGVGAFPIAVFTAGASGAELLGILDTSALGVSPSGSFLVPDAVSFVDGQILLTGNYLTDEDSRCCPSGVGWTSIAFVYGSLVASGVVATGEPPVTLPSRGARVDGDLIVYDPSVHVQQVADLEYLEGAPQDFRDFVWSEKQKLDGPGCEGVIRVSRLRLDGFAVGAEECAEPMGGADVLWSQRDGSWEVLLVHQNLPDCATLTAARFPAEMLGDSPMCLDDSYQEVPYSP
ncbi:hypothetical protein [Microbacterium pumilum]|uniref:hypothetical protein n=1 Tax=Microbacterium pumilum TaxID=344165 RepID=UPI0031DBF796